MGYLTEGYKLMGQEAANWIDKNRARIGTGVSVIGTIVSNILSTKAGAKSGRMIDAKEAELGRPLTFIEKTKLCWKNHIGSATTAAASCAGAVYSDNQHVKDFNKVATAYAGVKKAYDFTKQATREALGEKKNAEVQDKIIQKKMANDPDLKKKAAEIGSNPDPSVKQRYYDEASGEFLWSTKDDIMKAIHIMKLEMKALHPRERSGNLYRGKWGIKLRRFHELVNHDISADKLNSKIMNEGWNKGCEEDGSDDDRIGVTFSPKLIDDETKTAIAICWDVEPSDMSMGDYLKC